MALDKKMNEVVKNNSRFILEAISLFLGVSKGIYLSAEQFHFLAMASWVNYWLLLHVKRTMFRA